jgi:hypothetical protein
MTEVQRMNESGKFDFCPLLAHAITKRQMRGRTGRMFDGLAGLSSLNNLIVLRNLCLELKPKKTLEIGLSFGGSCLVFTSSHRDLGHTPDRPHVALDPFQATVWDDAGLAITEQAGLSPYLDFRATLSSLELPALIRENFKFGLIYIDGSHLFEDVFVDFYFVSRLLEDNGIVLFDDCSDQRVRKVINFVQTNCLNSFERLDLTAYRADQGRSIRYIVGKLLGRHQLRAFKRIGPPERAWNSRLSRF